MVAGGRGGGPECAGAAGPPHPCRRVTDLTDEWPAAWFARVVGRMRIVGATELRDQMREQLRRLRSEPVVIARRGRAVAVMLSVDAWNRLQDEIDDLEGHIRVLEDMIRRAGLDRVGPGEDEASGPPVGLPGSTPAGLPGTQGWLPDSPNMLRFLNRTVVDGWLYGSRVQPGLVDDEPYRPYG
jgi:prevent-host-death family protein